VRSDTQRLHATVINIDNQPFGVTKRDNIIWQNILACGFISGK
jgi:hypothetical protein